jgi:hypothetical protein
LLGVKIFAGQSQASRFLRNRDAIRHNVARAAP